jgi:hypothetical protein
LGCNLTFSGYDRSEVRTPLPPDLPHGRYRFFIEYRQDGKLIGTSHYWEMEL